VSSSKEPKLEISWSITPLTDENDPDGSRRDRQLRVIVDLLRNASGAKDGESRRHLEPENDSTIDS